jgi:hypothetical protein
LEGGLPTSAPPRPKAQQPAVPGAQVFEQGERLVLAAVALHDHDQARADAVFGARGLHRAQHALHHRGQRHAAAGVALHAEEHLRVQHAVGMRAAQVVARHVMEVLRLHQHAAAVVVQVQEVLQVGEAVGLAQRLFGLPADGHAVAPCQLQEQRGLDGAFDVHVQFGLGQARHELRGCHVRAPCRPWRPR